MNLKSVRAALLQLPVTVLGGHVSNGPCPICEQDPDVIQMRSDRQAITTIDKDEDIPDPATQLCPESSGAHDWVDEQTPDWEICGRCGAQVYRRSMM